MSKLRVLIVGDEGISLFLTNGKKIKRECSLPWMVPNFEDELIDVLKNKNRSTPVFILYDALEQQYRKEDIIKTNFMDQKKLLKRKLGSLFPNVLSYSYIELKDKKKKKSKEKEEKTHLSYLIAAVPHTEQMERIEYAITEARTDISGFALLPIESSSFAEAFSNKLPRSEIAPRWSLMISHHETGGLRQVFIKDGTLALTRLTPLAEETSSGEQWAEEVYKGFTTTLSYISRFGFSPSDGLDVIVMCNEHNKSLLKNYDFKGANLHCYSINETAKLFDFTIPQQQNKIQSQFADILHAGWLARKRKLRMSFKITWIQSIAIPRRAAKSIAFILFCTMFGAAALSIETWQEYSGIKEEISYKESNRTVKEEEYEEESKIFDNLPLKPITIRAALETKEALSKSSLYSYTVLEKVQSVLHGKAKLLKIIYLDARIPEEGFKKKTFVYVRPTLKKKHIKNLQITVRFALDETLQTKEKIETVKAIKTSFEMAFPKRRVLIDKQYGGNIIDTEAFSGQLGENIKPKATQGNKQNIENYAEISISGDHL